MWENASGLSAHPGGDSVVHGRDSGRSPAVYRELPTSSVNEMVGAVLAANLCLNGTIPHGHDRLVSIGISADGQPGAGLGLGNGQLRGQNHILQGFFLQKCQTVRIGCVQSHAAVQCQAQLSADLQMRDVLADNVGESQLFCLFQPALHFCFVRTEPGQSQIDSFPDHLLESLPMPFRQAGAVPQHPAHPAAVRKARSSPAE